MRWHDADGLVDIFGGMEDLKKELFAVWGRCNGKIFGRCFAHIKRNTVYGFQLGFEIDDEARMAMKELAPTLRKISAERIQVELVKR